MSKILAYAGALASALLVVSAGAAAAQSAELSEAGSDSGSGSGSNSASSQTEGGYLGELGEMAPASVTGSLPGYTTGPLGSTATLACNVGSVAGLAANLTGAPLPIPIGNICMIAKPLLESGDFLTAGDVQGSVDSVLAGIPFVGGSLVGKVDTSSVTEQVEELVGDRLGSLSESSLTPAN